MTVTDDRERVESIDEFTDRVRTWARATLDPLGATDRLTTKAQEMGLDPTESVARGRALLALMAEAGFAGLAFPTAYGGQGLSLDYLRAFNEGVAGYDFRRSPMDPHLGDNAPAMLEYGTEDAKGDVPPAHVAR